jgi:hypothetical protein
VTFSEEMSRVVSCVAEVGWIVATIEKLRYMKCSSSVRKTTAQHLGCAVDARSSMP